MRRFLLPFLLVPALTAAQPTAADSALVERLLPRLELELAHEAMASLGDQLEDQIADPGAAPFVADLEAAMRRLFRFDLAAATDSVRAAFYRDLRPDAIAEALVYLEGPTPGRLLAQARFRPGQLDLGEIMGLLEDPSGEPLADSALAARYSEALLDASMTDAVQRVSTEVLLAEVPASLRAGLDEALAEVGGFEGMVALQMAEQEAAQLEMAVLGNRLALAEVDEPVVREATAFYESDAGRYVTETTSLVFARLQAPAVAAMLRPMFDALARGVKQARRRAPAGAKPTGPLPAPPTEPDGPFEVVEVQPELIGGLAGLQRRVEYPEAARRRGIEGQVVVQFVVDEAGRVTHPVVLRTPDPHLSEAALAAVRASRFRPGMQEGRPVKVRFAVPITFRLRDPDPGELPRNGGW